MQDELPFFVYGTLRAGQGNSHLLRGAIARARRASLSGAQMFDLGPYPMIVEGEGLVWGELIEIEAARYAATLRALDRLEGVDGACPNNPNALYRRLRREVWVAEERVEAWVYFGREKIARRGRLVESGDWLERWTHPKRGHEVGEK